MNSSTIAFPRSVHEKYLGIVQLARTIDKAKMVANGTIGEYIYNCPMDQALFAEIGIDGKRLSAVVSDVVKNGSHLPAIEAYVKPLVQKKTQVPAIALPCAQVRNGGTYTTNETPTRVLSGLPQPSYASCL